MMCSIKNATFDLLNDMQSANVPIILTNDRIKNLVNVVGRADAHWDDDIAKEVIKLYDTIAPWKNRINDIVGCCLNTCNSIEEKERGQNPCNHILYNWSVLISVYEDHAIAYRSQIEPTPSTEATATDDKRAICLRSIVDHINDNLCKDLHKSVADVVMLIGDQIGQYINSIGTVEYLKFIEDNIAEHPKLNIIGRGNPILDKTREGNLFFAIDRLVGLFVGVNPDEQMNGSVYRQLCYECANVIRLSGWVDMDGCKPQTIYYNLWDCTLPLENAPEWGWYGHYLAKARVTDRFLFVTSIQENNKYFIDQLEDWGRIKKDWSSIATVLEYMLNEYAKRRFCIDNRGNVIQYKIDWLNNTILMCGDSKMSVFKMVINWCEDQLQRLNRNTPEPPRHEPPQAAEANATDDAALPDYSRMNSYTPTKGFEFDVSALYEFLVAEGVIDGIDEKLFANCITHAHINVLWQKGEKLRKRNILQCLFKILMQRYPDTWIAKCAENLDVDKKQITNPTSSGATQRFDNELRKVLKIKPSK